MGIQWSADGQWWWDGQKWQAVSQFHPQAASSNAAPSRSLLTFGAFACLGLALSAYLLLPTFVLTPVASILSISIGRAVRHSLPKTARRDRRIAGLGMILAALPLAVIILGIIAIQLIFAYMFVTGKHSIG